jgi:DNA polymerase-3 subunit gamma/tau
MKYQVLARKYRPKNFSAMIGQEHVLKALANALTHERLHHAYLFTGTRGVGKTTVARILAKALNCEQGVTATPCGQCSACQEIDQGSFVDLLEVDAASRTKVEDTRELLDNVQYAPTKGRYKIYLIDEVHMLSGHSFNALLKTLEEPPPHVKFLLATTDPQKLPVTILSRCLQFNLKRMTIEQIELQLENILNTEQIAFEQAALKPLAIAADGSMRDALSLLDQAIAYCDGQPNLHEIEVMLGSVQRDRIFQLLAGLINDDGKGLIAQVHNLIAQGIDANSILSELISLLQRVALAQLVPEAIDDSLGDKQRLEQMAQAISPEDVQLYYQIAINGRKDLPYSPQPQGGLDMILLRMLAFKPDVYDVDASQDSPQSAAVEPVETEKKNVEKIASAKLTASLAPSNTLPAEPQANEAPEWSRDELPPLSAYENNYSAEEREEESIDEQDADRFDAPVEAQLAPSVQDAAEYSRAGQREDKQAAVAEEIPSTQKTTPDKEQLPCEEAHPLADIWFNLIQKASVSGLEQQLAKHCALISQNESNGERSFELLLEPMHKHLLSDKIRNRLTDALEKLLESRVHLHINECQASERQLQTPRRREIHEENVRQQQAIQSIHNDPKVKLLKDNFAAIIRDETIKAI